MTHPTPVYPPALGQPQPGPYGPPPGGPTPPPYRPPVGPPAPPAGWAPPPDRPRRRTGLVVGAIVAAVLILAGLVAAALLLFGARTIDTVKAEAEIERLTEEEAGIAPTGVRCPDDVAIESGATFTCTANLDGQSISYTVRQTDDEGNVRIDSTSSFVLVGAVEESLRQQVGEDVGVEVLVTCDTDGRQVLVDGAGIPIPCTVTNATDPTDSAEVTAIVDDEGTVAWEWDATA